MFRTSLIIDVLLVVSALAVIAGLIFSIGVENFGDWFRSWLQNFEYRNDGRTPHGYPLQFTHGRV